MAKKQWIISLDYGENSYMDTGEFAVGGNEVAIELRRIDGDFTIIIPRTELVAFLGPVEGESNGTTGSNHTHDGESGRG